jgi:hypothetical protein
VSAFAGQDRPPFAAFLDPELERPMFDRAQPGEIAGIEGGAFLQGDFE